MFRSLACFSCVISFLIFVGDLGHAAGCSGRTISTYDWETSKTGGYRIKYPSDVFYDDGFSAENQPPYIHSFRSHNDDAIMTVIQYRNDEEWSFEELYAFDAEELGYADYTVKKRRWYVVSGHLGANTIYIKTYKRLGGAWFILLYLRYPSNQERKYDPIVECIEDSFWVADYG